MKLKKLIKMDEYYPDTGIDWILEKQRNPYVVSGKSVETRMRVVIEQLLIDMITDMDMDQLKKSVALKYIDKMRAKLLKAASKEGTPYEVVSDFKKKLAVLKQRLLIKQAKEVWELKYDQMFR